MGEAPTLLWEPSDERKARANVTRYMRWLGEDRGVRHDSYRDLWQWSVTDLEAFWGSLWDFFEVKAHRPYEQVLAERRMPDARWFTGATLNYAEHSLRRRDDHPAVVFQSELRPLESLSYGQLSQQVASAAAGLRRVGVGKGDRVVAYMPNIPETLVAFLATASIGAIWSVCAPEFGTRVVADRFLQIEPKVLLAVDGYRYGGRDFHRTDAVAEIQRRLPTLEHTVMVPYLAERPDVDGLAALTWWDELLSEGGELTFEPVPFDHPLWVLFSSGTTGLPKAIVHGHGGILLEHLKSLSLHVDLTDEDRLFWYTTTGWMMWNFLIGGLLLGSTVLLYDGNPGHPDMGTLWRFAQDARASYFGASAAYIQACMKAGITPAAEFDLTALNGLGSTGSPLPPEGFHWVYESVKPDILLNSYSGGTDMCTGFVGSCPLLPVHAGEIQARCLGARVESYDPEGRPLVDQVGELVITEPMPSMPLYFWSDPDGTRLRESYFEMFPGVWRHGDWIEITGRETCVIYGRSDSTLNRGGVRMGTSEFYRVVEEVEEVLDSLVLDTGQAGVEGRLLLFLVMREGAALGDVLRGRIVSRLRRDLSPRHAPDEVHAIPEVPRTLNGKKVEVPVKRILAGTPVDEAISRDAMSNPGSLDYFVALARSS